jgi:hypothetical protein
MTYHVHAVEQDMAAKWYARVCITEEEAVFLKFQDYPTMDAIQEAAVAYVATQQQQPAVEELGDGATE